MPLVTNGDAEIYYEVHGEGPVLVFAHGMGGNHLSWWQQVPDFELRGYRAVTFDHRGFGRSRCPPEHFHPRHFPDDLFAILDALEVERAALVCQSMGGWTGLRDVAARIPGAEVVDFPGVGHSTYFEDAARFNRIVGDFLEKHFPA